MTVGLDTNIIIHLLVKSQPEHKLVKKWFLSKDEACAMTQTNMAEVLRLLTHPRVFPKPLKLKAAIDLMSRFVEEADVLLLEEASDWWQELPFLTKDNPSLKGNEIFDARIALCLKHNGIKELVTLDADFKKYSFIKVINPI